MSGKLTTALELARVLSCRESGLWDCQCKLCGSHRLLSHHRTLIAGNRDMGPEIAASAGVLRRDISDASRFLVVRSVRKLLRRFDPVLWEGEEKKLIKVRPLMERLSETVNSLSPGNPLAKGNKLEKILDTLVDDCMALQKSLPFLLSVFQVRQMSIWGTHSAGKDHKTIIIDAADRMHGASQNALLKFLEEPPGDTSIILITNRKSLLLPTILSRLRIYNFLKRSVSEEAEIIRRIFKEEKTYGQGLSEYFQSEQNKPSERIRQLATEFIDLAVSGDFQSVPALEEIENHANLIVFLEALGGEMKNRWRESVGGYHAKRVRETALLRDALFRAENLNFPIHTVLRGLFISLGTSGA